MAEDLRQGRRGEDVWLSGCDDGAGNIFVEIGAADAGPQRFHQELVGAEVLGLIDGFDTNVFPSVITNSLHGRSSLYGRCGRFCSALRFSALSWRGILIPTVEPPVPKG